MQLSRRNYQNEDDYWRIGAFLRQVFWLNDRHERCWQVARLDYWRWHGVQNCGVVPSIEDVTFVWETTDGQIGAVLNPEGKGEAHFQVHPAFRSLALEEEMLAVAEAQFSNPGADGKRRLTVWAHEDDSLRRNLLTHHGYSQGEEIEYQRQRLLDDSIPEISAVAGYTIRSLGGIEELPARSWASWRAFHPDEPDENYEGWEWYQTIQRIPLYCRDLDIVAATPTGEVAAFCTLWYDDVTRTGYFEPVGTVPEHQQRGLGKAVMRTAMRRIKRMGGSLVTVAGFSPAANALYTAVVAPDCLRLEPWQKHF
jgi:GNAT superfamily N-acetyltransferase